MLLEAAIFGSKLKVKRKNIVLRNLSCYLEKQFSNKIMLKKVTQICASTSQVSNALNEEKCAQKNQYQ